MLEEKLTDRREYLDLIAQTKGNNDDLYKKMVQTGETRGDAFFTSDDNPKNGKVPKPPNNTKDIQPLRRTKFNRTRKNSHKSNNNSKTHDNDTLNDNKIEIEQDEEMVAVTWAYKILKTELHRRYEVRGKKKLPSLNSTKKLAAYLRFKQELEVRTGNQNHDDDILDTIRNMENEGDTSDNSKNSSIEKVGQKNVVIKNMASANSIVNFMKGSNTSVERPTDKEDLPSNEQEACVLNNKESNDVKLNEKTDFTTSQTFVNSKNQIDDAQKIIDKVMPKRIIEEHCIQTDSKGGLPSLNDGGAIDARAATITGFQEEGKIVVK